MREEKGERERRKKDMVKVHIVTMTQQSMEVISYEEVERFRKMLHGRIEKHYVLLKI